MSKDWLQQGLEFLKDRRFVAVEGRTYYVSKDYEPTFSDNVIKNEKGGYLTCNIAYKKRIIESIGGFDERYKHLDDRDLALRAMKLGEIYFNAKMVVYHQKRISKPKEFVQKAKWIRDRVLLYKKFGERKHIIWKIFYPLRLISILFPPLILGSLLRHRYKTKEDFTLLPYNYMLLIFERINLWQMCAQERVFLI